MLNAKLNYIRFFNKGINDANGIIYGNEIIQTGELHLMAGYALYNFHSAKTRFFF